MNFEQFNFAYPQALWLLLLLPILAIWYILSRKKQMSSLRVSSTEGFAGYRSLRLKIKPLLFIFRVLCIGLIVLALASPQVESLSVKTKSTRGIDIVMAIDASSSMLAKDLKPNRLNALKKVATEFVRERRNDRIGLVVYAGESYTKTPVTSDKNIVIKAVKDITYGDLEDGTAIGMGLSTSVNRLKESNAKSKVIILLTDGMNNSGFIDPEIATEMAIEYDIKVYTIGIGTNGMAMTPVAYNPDRSLRFGLQKVEIDEKLLRNISKKTGGVYFRAKNNQELKTIYAEIDKLEKIELEELRYYNYDKKYRIITLLAGFLIVSEIFMRYTIFKTFI